MGFVLLQGLEFGWQRKCEALGEQAPRDVLRDSEGLE
jgi:hypothetical protein